MQSDTFSRKLTNRHYPVLPLPYLQTEKLIYINNLLFQLIFML